jgi:transcriptional regulator with XRE-family HTH domain
MEQFGRTLAAAMERAGVSQAELARLTGVAQGRISEYTRGRTGLSADMFAYLLSPLGFKPHVEITLETPAMNRSDRRSWYLHRAVARKIVPDTLREIGPLVQLNITRQREGVRGEPHLTNLARWEALFRVGDVKEIRRLLLDPGEAGRAMRDVTPFAGVLTETERLAALQEARRAE